MTFLLNLILGIKNSPLVTRIIRVLGEVMGALPPGLVAKAFILVADAAENPLLTNSEKFRWVARELSKEYPDIRENLINVLINSVLEARKKGLV